MAEQLYPITKASCVKDVLNPINGEREQLDEVLKDIGSSSAQNQTLPQAAGSETVRSGQKVGGVPVGFEFTDGDVQWTPSQVLALILFPDTTPYVSSIGGFDGKKAVSTTTTIYVGETAPSISFPSAPANATVKCLNLNDISIPYGNSTTSLDTWSAIQSKQTTEASTWQVTYRRELNTDGITIKTSRGTDTNLNVYKTVTANEPLCLWGSKNTTDTVGTVVGAVSLTFKLDAVFPEVIVEYVNHKSEAEHIRTLKVINKKAYTEISNFNFLHTYDTAEHPETVTINGTNYYYAILYVKDGITLPGLDTTNAQYDITKSFAKVSQGGFTLKLNVIGLKNNTVYLKLKSGNYASQNSKWEVTGSTDSGKDTYKQYYLCSSDASFTSAGITLKLDF